MYFDSKAADWDKDPKKAERAAVFAKEIDDFIKPNKKLTALEFGCGTGLLSIHLKDSFKTITLADNSAGMIKVLKEKIVRHQTQHFIPLQADLFEEINSYPKVDAVYTLMTLHHMFDLDKTIKSFSTITVPGGYLCIGDLLEEDGSFHQDAEDEYGYNGFAGDELSQVLLKYGFDTVYYNLCYTIEKELEGEMREYPLFLLIGKKASR